jgi:hypothetical protein
MRIKYYEYVCVCIPVLVIQHEDYIFSASHYVFVYGLSGFTTFFAQYVMKGKVFGKTLLNIKCVL